MSEFVTKYIYYPPHPRPPSVTTYTSASELAIAFNRYSRVSERWGNGMRSFSNQILEVLKILDFGNQPRFSFHHDRGWTVEFDTPDSPAHEEEWEEAMLKADLTSGVSSNAKESGRKPVPPSRPRNGQTAERPVPLFMASREKLLSLPPSDSEDHSFYENTELEPVADHQQYGQTLRRGWFGAHNTHDQVRPRDGTQQGSHAGEICPEMKPDRAQRPEEAGLDIIRAQNAKLSALDRRVPQQSPTYCLEGEHGQDEDGDTDEELHEMEKEQPPIHHRLLPRPELPSFRGTNRGDKRGRAQPRRGPIQGFRNSSYLHDLTSTDRPFVEDGPPENLESMGGSFSSISYATQQPSFPPQFAVPGSPATRQAPAMRAVSVAPEITIPLSDRPKEAPSIEAPSNIPETTLATPRNARKRAASTNSAAADTVPPSTKRVARPKPSTERKVSAAKVKAAAKSKAMLEVGEVATPKATPKKRAPSKKTLVAAAKKEAEEAAEAAAKGESKIAAPEAPKPRLKQKKGGPSHAAMLSLNESGLTGGSEGSDRIYAPRSPDLSSLVPSSSISQGNHNSNVAAFDLGGPSTEIPKAFGGLHQQINKSAADVPGVVGHGRVILDPSSDSDSVATPRLKDAIYASGDKFGNFINKAAFGANEPAQPADETNSLLTFDVDNGAAPSRGSTEEFFAMMKAHGYIGEDDDLQGFVEIGEAEQTDKPNSLGGYSQNARPASDFGTIQGFQKNKTQGNDGCETTEAKRVMGKAMEGQQSDYNEIVAANTVAQPSKTPQNAGPSRMDSSNVDDLCFDADGGSFDDLDALMGKDEFILGHSEERNGEEMMGFPMQDPKDASFAAQFTMDD